MCLYKRGGIVKKVILILGTIAMLSLICFGCESKEDKINSLVNEANNYFNGGYFDEANLKYIEALNIEKSEEVNELLIKSYITEGDELYDKGDINGTVSKYESAVGCLDDETNEELTMRTKGRYHIYSAKKYADEGKIYEQIKEQIEANNIVDDYNDIQYEKGLYDNITFDVLDIEGYEPIYDTDVKETMDAYNFYTKLIDFLDNDVDLNASVPSSENAKNALEKLQNYIKEFRELYGKMPGDTVASTVDEYFWYVVDYWEEGGRKASNIGNETPEITIANIKEDVSAWAGDRHKLLVDDKYSEIIFSYDNIMELF